MRGAPTHLRSLARASITALDLIGERNVSQDLAHRDSRLAARNIASLDCPRQPSSSLRRISYGGTAAIVTSMAVIVGLNAATAEKSALVGSLLIIALADNLTDSLGVHVYQEAERLAERDAFRTTLTNFATRLLVSLSFVGIVILLPLSAAILTSIGWGLSMLAALSYSLAKARSVKPLSEIWKHCAIALLVVAVSAAIGTWVPRWLGR